VAALNELFPRVQAALRWAERRRTADGLLPKGDGIDWYWTANRGPGPTTSLNALYVASLEVAADLAGQQGLSELRDSYQRQAAEVRDAIELNLWDATAGAYVDGDLRTHHPLDGNALAVEAGIASDARATQALQFIRDQLWTPVGTLAADRPYGAWAHDGAVWPAYVFPELEARFRRGDDLNALDVLRRTWGNMLAHDPSSTVWEFARHDGSIHSGSVSLAHGWSTAALPVLSRWVLGIRPRAPGYAEYVIEPHMGDVDWACGTVPTPYGPIRTAWTRTPERITLWVDAPTGTLGHVNLQLADSAQLHLDGQPLDASADLDLQPLSPGRHVIDVTRR
jgi:alpha-L-rhamnosidase